MLREVITRNLLKLQSTILSWPIWIYIINLISFLFVIDHPSFLTFIGLLTTISITVYLTFKNQKTKLIYPLVSLLFLSFIIHHFHDNPLSKNITKKKATYLAQVESIKIQKATKTVLVLNLQKRLNPAQTKIQGRILLSLPEQCKISSGSEIQFYSSIYPPKSFKNSGVFSYKSFLKRQYIYGKTFLEGCDEIQVIKNSQTGLLENLRQTIKNSIYKSEIKNKDLIITLLLGEKSLEKTTKDKLISSGLSHLFVISGLHIGLIAFIIYQLLNFILSFFPKIFLYVPKQKISSLITSLFIIFYTLLCIKSPSIYRASLMSLLILGSTLFHYQKNISHFLALTLFLNLILSPLDFFTASFQLSYTATFFLIFIFPKVQNILNNNIRDQVFLSILSFFITSILLNLFLLPLTNYHFSSFNLNGLVHNIWAIPTFTFLIIPIILCLLFNVLILPNHAAHLLEFCDFIISKFFWFLEQFSLLDLNFNFSLKLHLEHVILFYLAIIIFALVRNKFITLALSFVVIFSILLTNYQQKLRYDFKFTQIDVGQGDAILLEGDQKTIMIDSGGHPYLDLGANVLKPFFDYKWIQGLDLAIITHPDLDHFGSFLTLIDFVPIRKFILPTDQSNDPTYKELIQKIKDKKIPFEVITQNQILKFSKNFSLEILTNQNLKNDNDRSLVILSRYNHHQVLFTGDISKKREYQLLAKYNQKLKSDILKISHHGSKSSSSDLFLETVKPKFASIGVGENSHFGHPHKLILNKLKNKGIKTYRTDKNGEINFQLEGNQWTVKTYTNE